MIPAINKIYFFLAACILFACTKESQNAATTDIGKGGSLAKFTIAGNYLYVVDDYSLYTYDISNPVAPSNTHIAYIGNSIETIYPYKNRLFIGSANGMFIYSIDTPYAPVKMGSALHVRSCDPVVANDTVAYVTLKGGSRCGPATSGLYIHDITNLFQPLLKNTIEIGTPEGLGLVDTTLYVCNNSGGLKIYNISNPYDPIERKTINDGNNYKDVIPYGDLLICYISSGIILYDITNRNNPASIKSIAN